MRRVGNDLEGKGESAGFRLGRCHESFGHGVHIGGEHGIVDDGHILAYLRRRFLAELNVLLFGKEIKARLELGGTWGGRGGG